MQWLGHLAQHVPNGVILASALGALGYFVRGFLLRRERWAFKLGRVSIGVMLVFLGALVEWSQANGGLEIAMTSAVMVFGAGGVVLLGMSRVVGHDPDQLDEGWDPTAEIPGEHARQTTARRIR